MKGLCKAALAMLLVAACGRDGAITEPDAPKALPPAQGVNALGVDTTTGASIETNKDDYVPGEIVHVVGKGWAPGETVNLSMTEDPDTHADVAMDVQADSVGGFSVHYYDVQTHDLGVTFTLTATGQTSNSKAVATFTDGNVSVKSSPAGVPSFTTGAYVKYNGNATCGSTGTTSTGAFNVNSSTFTVVTGISNTQSLKLSVPATLTGYTFSSWSIGSPAIHVSGSLTSPTGLCIAIPASSDQPNITANYTLSNVAPSVDAGGPYIVAEGTQLTLSPTVSDPDGDALTYKWTINTAGIDAGGACSFDDNTLKNAKVTCTDDSDDAASDKFILTLEVKDATHTVTDNADLTVTNAIPTAGAGGPYTGNEGSAVSISGTKSDPGSNDTHTYAWTWAAQSGVDAGASCSFGSATSLSTTVTCTDDGTFKLTLTVTDDDGGSDAADATLTLGNVAPTVSIISPLDGALFSLLNGAIAVSANYSDAGTNDTHTCQLELDGATDAVVSYFAVSGSPCTGSILPPEAGVYNLTVRVKDDDNGIGSATIMIVVYDPTAGFVTGGGWIDSPAGAYLPDVTLSGKATFGFVSRYKRGATVPEGNTEFQFHAGGMNFHSHTYQWLVVNQAATNAQFKGTGTINGAGSYTFMLWATDGGNTGDKFRIQITDDNNGDALVYDNGADQLITSGSIVIHTGSKK